MFLSLGSNLGLREKNLKMAVDSLKANNFTFLSFSSIYETEPWHVPDKQPNFYNQVIKVKTGLYPFGLLTLLQKIEKGLGREGKGTIQPRSIDIDILFFNDWKIFSPQLTIPHQQFKERMFVLKPLNEIAPDWIDPNTQKSVSQLYKGCLDTLLVNKIS
ncbi:MAG: 2-amino-4-hydroxy-6-hydroxymethyldihydropteridine diphosphokinase [Chitinophagales bacterium]|nr:2-amino-4-hydroxy-6-hydroxymethyldihydropteridine diphosphokinase [Chitinophagales bacterium]